MSGVGVIKRLLVVMGSARLKCWSAILACVGLEIAQIALATAGPYALKVLIDGLSQPGFTHALLFSYAALFVIATTATTVLGPLRNVYSSRINARVAETLSTGALTGLFNSGKWRDIDSGRTHGLLERLPYSLSVVVDGLIWRTAPLAIQLAISLVVIVKMTALPYLLSFAGMAIGFVAVSWIGVSRQVKAARSYNEAVATSGERIGDILKNARRVVANWTADFEISGVEATFGAKSASEQYFNWSFVQLAGVQWILLSGALVFMVSMAVADCLAGRITSGDFVLLQAYALRLVVPLSAVAFVLSQSASALATIGEVLDLQGDRQRKVEPTWGPGKPLFVVVEAVSFTYGPGLSGVKDISIAFPAGSYSVIVGANGSGKSTLAQLIAGILPPAAGRVLVGGQRLDQSGESWRTRAVLYVPQRPSLFNRDLKSNILYPPTAHTEADAFRWLETWSFQDGGRVIDPTLRVGEGGSALSGGQAQKLELARLMGVRVPCLILDESTSALDPKSEARIIADLRKAIGLTTTMILVSHRISMAEDADQVVWMSAGKIAAVGAHLDLLEFEEYRELWNIEGEVVGG